MWITYYLLSHKDNNIIRTNSPVTPPDKNEPTRLLILVTTSIPNQPEPKITVDKIETDTFYIHVFFSYDLLLIRMNNLL